MNFEYTAPNEEAVRLVVAHQATLKVCISLVIRNPQLAQETLSDVMLAILKRWESYDQTRPFAGWACGVARHVAMANRRKASQEAMWIADVVLEDLIQEVDDQDESILELRKRALMGCVEALPFLQRQLIKLRYYESRPYGEISGVVGRTVATLYVSCNRAHKILLNCIQGQLRRL
jgi:RNA polymerase sigma-70 factor, ECF subfamily